LTPSTAPVITAEPMLELLMTLALPKPAPPKSTTILDVKPVEILETSAVASTIAPPPTIVTGSPTL
jgi:hypothetical protein